MFKSFRFKYRAWKLLNNTMSLSSGNINDFTISFFRVFNDYSVKPILYEKVKDIEVECRSGDITSVNDAMVNTLAGLRETGYIDETFLDGHSRQVLITSFVQMDVKGSPSPHLLIGKFLKLYSELFNELSKIHSRINNQSAVSYNYRKLLPLALVAREILLITLLGEGEDYETIKRFTNGKY